MPIGVGPYMITEWVKGEKMVFEANPYCVFGEPKTQNFVISFITAENAEAQLLGGQVDVLDSHHAGVVTRPSRMQKLPVQVTLVVDPGANLGTHRLQHVREISC